MIVIGIGDMSSEVVVVAAASKEIGAIWVFVAK